MTVLKILTYALVSTWSSVSSVWVHVKRKMHPCLTRRWQTIQKKRKIVVEREIFSCAGIDCWDGGGKGGFCLICLRIRSRPKGGMDGETKKPGEKKLLSHFFRFWKKSSQAGCEKKRCGVVKAGSYFNQGGEWVRWGNCVSEISFLERRHNDSFCSFSKLYRFNSYQILTKILLSNLEQNSASKSWPDFSLNTLTKIQLQNLDLS